MYEGYLLSKCKGTLLYSVSQKSLFEFGWKILLVFIPEFTPTYWEMFDDEWFWIVTSIFDMQTVTIRILLQGRQSRAEPWGYSCVQEKESWEKGLTLLVQNEGGRDLHASWCCVVEMKCYCGLSVWCEQCFFLQHSVKMQPLSLHTHTHTVSSHWFLNLIDCFVIY